VDGCGGGSGGGAGGEGCISCGEGGGRASTPAHGTLGALCAGLEEITPERAFAFSKRRLDGKDLNRLPHLAETGRRVVQALRDVRMRAIKAFEAVAVFAQLLPEQIERLYENMGRATYQPGEAIFEQDDNGDTFYIVIEGSADVTRWEDDVEKTIASLGSGSVFGERALIEPEGTRYATVRAVSVVSPLPPPDAQTADPLAHTLCSHTQRSSHKSWIQPVFSSLFFC